MLRIYAHRLMKFGGIVTKHTGMGRKLGFPTANIEAPPAVSDGLYLGFTIVENKRFPSLIFVGTADTFAGRARQAESYILDFPNQDLYDLYIELEIVKKLRDNRKFPDKKSLIAQMKEDERHAREYFENL